MIEDQNNAIIEEPPVYNKKIITKKVPKPNIGVEHEYTLTDQILTGDNENKIDLNILNSFIEATKRRDTQYDIIDQMCQDSIPAAILELFTEDSTATNEDKEAVWVTSDDPVIAKTVKYYIDSLQVNKNIYQWANSFIKYGDLYLRLYKRSEYDKDDIFDSEEKQTLNEDINLHINKPEDKFVNYVEMVENPATTFELKRLGKTAGYIQTQGDAAINLYNGLLTSNGGTSYQYSVHKKDVDVYLPNQFVHATLDDNVDRIDESLKIITDDNADHSTSYTYKIKHGQSIFFNVFRIWRELSLLENSLILSRVTKSSITRVIQVETGQTAKEETGPILQRLKEMIEQKAALNPGSNMAEYTNPGPMENNIYIATHDNKGAITTTQIGGDYDPKTLTDLDYFKNKFYGSFGIPKQFFGDTDDGAGFNGGQSLTIISSKYAKKIVKIQTALCNMITSLINILLIDRRLDSYINKFTINMLTPTTQEDLDRRDAIDRQIQNVNDIMNLLNDVDDKANKLKILKSLLSNIVNNNDIIDALEEEIDSLTDNDENSEDSLADNTNAIESDNIERDTSNKSDTLLDTKLGLNNDELEIDQNIEDQNNQETILPTPGETGVDLINNVDEI